jgi:hypothetical protein
VIAAGMSPLGRVLTFAISVRGLQAAERLNDGYAVYFQKYDVFLTPVLPTPSFKHNQAEMLINGQTVKIMGINVRDIAVECYRLAGRFHAVRHQP